MSDEIPPVPAGADEIAPEQKRLAAAEYELLEASAKARKQKNRENDQRFQLRWIAVVVGLIVMICMATILAHVVHHLFVGPFLAVPGAFAVVAILAPMVSLTTITIVVFVAAFRQFKEDDDVAIGSLAAQAGKAAGLFR